MDNLKRIRVVKSANIQLTKAERKAYYDAKSTADKTNAMLYNAFFEMENNLIADQLPDTNIISILFDSIIKYCIPIITGLSSTITDRPQYQAQSNLGIQRPTTSETKMRSVKGQTIALIRAPILEMKINSDEYNFYKKLDHDQICIVYGKFINASKNTMIGIQGIRTWNKRPTRALLKYVDYSIPFPNRQIMIDIGAFSSADSLTGVPYLQQFWSFADLKQNIIFSSDTQVLEEITRIYGLISLSFAMRKSNFDLIQSRTQSQSALPKFDIKISIQTADNSQINKFLLNHAEQQIYDRPFIFSAKNALSKAYFQLLYTDLTESQQTTIDNFYNRNPDIQQQNQLLRRIQNNQAKTINDKLSLWNDLLSISSVFGGRVQKRSYKIKQIKGKLGGKVVNKSASNQAQSQLPSSTNIAKHVNKPASNQAQSQLPSSTDIARHVNILYKKTALIDGICPHLILEALQRLEGGLINSGAFASTGRGAHFCKICGMTLSFESSDDMGGDSWVNDVDDLRLFIWKTISSIMQKVKFNQVGKKEFMSDISDLIYNEISNIQSKLSKIRSKTVAEIRRMLYQHVVVYIYTVLIDAIASQPAEIVQFSDVFHKGISSTRRSTPSTQNNMNLHNLQDLFKIAADRIVKMVESPAQVKDQLLTAYRWVLSKKNKTLLAVQQVQPFALLLSLDQLYRYIHTIANINQCDNITIKSKNATTHFVQLDDVEHLLGRSIQKLQQDLKNDISIYATAVVAEAKYAKPLKSMLDYIANYIRIITPQSGIVFSKYIIKPLTTNDISNISNVLISDPDSFIASLMNKQKRAIYNIRAEFELKSRTTDNDDKQITVDLESINLDRYYCPNGNRHKFNIFVYDFGDAQADDVHKKLDSDHVNILEGHKLIDFKCSKCGRLLKDVSKSAINLHQKMQLEELRNEFFLYYELRCPMGKIHEIQNNACVKCGYSSGSSNTGMNKDKYFKQFEDIYLEHLSHVKAMFHQPLTSLTSNASAQLSAQLSEISSKQEIAKKHEKHEKPVEIPITNVLYELAQLTKITYNQLINLGLSEGLKYRLLEQELANPHIKINAATVEFRNRKLKGYVLWLMRTCLRSKDAEVRSNMLPKEREMFTKTLLNNIDNIVNTIINADFNNSLDEIKGTELSAFLLSKIAKFITKVHDADGNLFSNWLINQLIGFERTVAIPEPLQVIGDKSSTKIIDEEIEVEDSTVNVEAMDATQEAPANDFSIADIDVEQGEGFDDVETLYKGL